MKGYEQVNDNNTGDDGSLDRADEPKTCASCGRQIDTTEWHPLVTRTDDDGNFQLYAFCRDECRDEWVGDTSETGGET